MDTANTLQARATHTYSCSPDRVFNAWLAPDEVNKWMFGPAIRDEEVVSIEIDGKVGGAFSFLVRRGNQVIDHIGTYAVIDRPSRLEFDWGVKGMKDSSRVAVSIHPHDNGCKLELIHYLHPDWAEYLQRSIEGWAQMLEVLDRHLKTTATK